MLYKLPVLELVHAALCAYHYVSFMCWVKVDAEWVNVGVAYFFLCRLFELRPALSVPHVYFALAARIKVLVPQPAYAIKRAVVEVYAVEIV